MDSLVDENHKQHSFCRKIQMLLIDKVHCFDERVNAIGFLHRCREGRILRNGNIMVVK